MCGLLIEFTGKWIFHVDTAFWKCCPACLGEELEECKHKRQNDVLRLRQDVLCICSCARP